MTKLERQRKNNKKKHNNTDAHYFANDPDHRIEMPDTCEHGSARAALRTKCGCSLCTKRRAKMRRRGLLV